MDGAPFDSNGMEVRADWQERQDVGIVCTVLVGEFQSAPLLLGQRQDRRTEERNELQLMLVGTLSQWEGQHPFPGREDELFVDRDAGLDPSARCSRNPKVPGDQRELDL